MKRARATVLGTALVGLSCAHCSAGTGGPSPSGSGTGGTTVFAGGSTSTGPSTASGGLGTSAGSGPQFGGAIETETRGCGEALVLFVVDRSGSMNCNLPPTTATADCEANPVRVDPQAPSKWEVTTSTLSTAFDRLVVEGLTVKAGLTYFSQDDECGVLSQPTVPLVDLALGHVDTMRTSLETARPAGGTPIVGATIAAYKHLNQQVTDTGDRYVVILTDGSDQCYSHYDADLGPDDWTRRLLDVEMPKALSVNIKTFVIGAPGSEAARNFLSRMAVAGGTAREGCDPGSAPDQGDCHFDMTSGDFAAALGGALGEIADIVTCADLR